MLTKLEISQNTNGGRVSDQIEWQVDCPAVAQVEYELTGQVGDNMRQAIRDQIMWQVLEVVWWELRVKQDGLDAY